MQFRIDYYETFKTKDGEQFTKYEFSSLVDTENAKGYRHFVAGIVDGKVKTGIYVKGYPEFSPGEIVEAISEVVQRRDGSLYTKITGFRSV